MHTHPQINQQGGLKDFKCHEEKVSGERRRGRRGVASVNWRARRGGHTFLKSLMIQKCGWGLAHSLPPFNSVFIFVRVIHAHNLKRSVCHKVIKKGSPDFRSSRPSRSERQPLLRDSGCPAVTPAILSDVHTATGVSLQFGALPTHFPLWKIPGSDTVNPQASTLFLSSSLHPWPPGWLQDYSAVTLV